MKKFMNYMFDKAPYYVLLLIGFGFSFGSIFILLMISMADSRFGFDTVLYISTVVGFISSFILPLFINIHRRNTKFYEFADRIENLIDDNADKDTVHSDICELQKTAYHPTHGFRIRELAKLYEKQYGVKLLKD